MIVLVNKENMFFMYLYTDIIIYKLSILVRNILYGKEKIN